MRRVLGLLCVIAGCGDDSGQTGDDAGTDAPVIGATACEPLAMPAGNIIDVTPAQADELGLDRARRAVRRCHPTCRWHVQRDSPGVVMNFSKPGLTLISASRDASKVIIDGGAHVSHEIVQITASDVTIAHITLKNARDHLDPSVSRHWRDIHGAKIYGLVIIDGGQQFIKSNTDKSNAEIATAHFVDDVTVACTTFTMTAAGRAYVPTIPTTRATPATRAASTRTPRRAGWYAAIASTASTATEPLAEHAIHFWQTAAAIR